MRHIITAVVTLIATSCLAVSAGNDIDRALQYHRDNYPQAQLADIYKSFYQDAFGPSHLLADTLKSRAYIERELADTSRWDGPMYEPAGTGRNFYRVNLEAVRCGKVPKDTFIRAFEASSQRVSTPSPDEWRREWQSVDSALTAIGWHFPDEMQDREMISGKLHDGDFTVHHSDRYNATYRFHYRIIATDIFRTTILPLLGQ